MMGVGMLFAATSCEDFLDTSSPSEADVDFVFSEASTARAALYNAYEKWRGNAGVHSNGVFYDLVVCGSDAERHPEAYASQIARHVPENLYGYSDATFTKKGPSNYTISQYGNAKRNLGITVCYYCYNKYVDFCCGRVFCFCWICDSGRTI